MTKVVLMIVFDEADRWSIDAAEVVAAALGNEGQASYRHHREDLDFTGWSVAFIGAPPAPETLRRALAEARAVGVFALHKPDIRPKDLIWAYGDTLLHAAINGTGYRPSVA